jgi:hypothetical protein
MSENPQLHRDMGRIEGRLDAIETQAAETRQKVDEMHRVLMQAQGSWKAIVGAAGLSAFITGGLIKLGALLGILR